MKTVLITGASSGLGFELARLFGADGYHLILSSSSHTRLERAAGKLSAFSSSIEIIPADLSSQEGAASLWKKASTLANIDVLVCCAGIGYSDEFDQMPIDSIEKLIQVNDTSLAVLNRLALAQMRKRKSGQILNIASIGAFTPGPMNAIYYASKSFVYSLSMAIAHEAKKDEVSVSVFVPGAIDTEFFAKTGQSVPAGAVLAAKAAKKAYTGLKKGKQVIYSGVLFRLSRFIPINIRMNAVYWIRKKGRKKDPKV